MRRYDVVVIGAGPAGLAASRKAYENGASVLLLEREAKLGGILKQCIHDGFGLWRFKEKLSGPEYAEREIASLANTSVEIRTLTYVSDIKKNNGIFNLTLITRNGIEKVEAKNIILATGCRERTARQIFIQGTNPAGVFTAGSAQYYINILGQMPTKKCVILGSGDIGLIMARRITLEGGKVVGVYEVKPTPSGLSRNIAQCLNDFQIPLHLSHTVTRVFGSDRLTAVEICKVDENMRPLIETAEIIECDALIISVGLIPENEIAEKLNVVLNPKTKGPLVDQTLMTMGDNIYSCGNALHVSDLADFVSESGEIAGFNAAKKDKKNRDLREIAIDKHLSYVVPSHIDFAVPHEEIIVYFRSANEYENVNLIVEADGQLLFKKRYQHLRPPEMERLVLNLSKLQDPASLHLRIEDLH
ncbi:MAG: NAD(P)/FAD-dependent oxidoreductase [Bacilli bacterium]|jgi:thioredoxin reductase